MIFKSITLTNLFSYHGKCHFDLEPTGDGNIVVIMGRNGQGKTSFINGAKLLFMGPSLELRRQVTTAKDRIPTENQYVCGTEGLWGILNHRAVLAGERSCSVRAEWLGDEGEVVVERRWNLLGGMRYREEIIVDAPLDGPLDGEIAQAYLDRHLPKDFIPFFFFDGEEVRELAEGNSNETIAKMELLLDIRPMENLQDGLKALRKRWRHQAADREREEELTAKENRLKQLEAIVDRLDQQLADLKVDLAEAESDHARGRRQIEVLRGSSSGEDGGQLRERLELRRERQGELLQELAKAFLGDAFLRLSPRLMDGALHAAESCAHGEAANQAELLAGLKEQLPEIFSTPPYPRPLLTEGQVAFYRQRLTKRLEEYEVLTAQDSLFSLPANQARMLYKQLAEFEVAKKPASALVSRADEIRELEQTIEQVERQLAGATQLSRGRQEELNRLIERDAELGDRLLDLRDKERELERDRLIAGRERAEVGNALAQLSEAVEQASEARGKFDFAHRLVDLLEAVKGRLRQQKRGELEEAYDRHLPQLLDSNRLLRSVEIDEHFFIRYRNDEGEMIPMSSISAGMKQLSATALLWALKEVSGRQIPLIIDTPLGRIDRAHQENLLRNYYPTAGRQVILLATDSELDKEKHALLAPHIYREYSLINPSGEETKVEKREVTAHG